MSSTLRIHVFVWLLMSHVAVGTPDVGSLMHTSSDLGDILTFDFDDDLFAFNDTDDRTGLEESPLAQVQALVDGRALLPCDITPSLINDHVILVLFYHGARGTPIYSMDARGGPLVDAVHWVDEDALGARAYFDLAASPPGLVIRPVHLADQMEYRCRVDFNESPTRNARVHLNVIEPPKSITIVSATGLALSGLVGPYPVGATVSFTCRIRGGSPRPGVTWWHGEELLDDVVDVQEEERDGDAAITSNVLHVSSLTRRDLFRVFTCQTSNSNLSVPLAAAVTINMMFPPLSVSISGGLTSLVEEEPHEAVCEASGSRPTATITWWKNGQILAAQESQVFHEGNVSRSTLQLLPTLTDDGMVIACRAENPRLPGKVVEDAKTLNVAFRPRVSLAAGGSLDMDDIKEGDDVYFECSIKANPRNFKIQWFHNEVPLVHNVSVGVIQSNQSLVLQHVSRGSSGRYACQATNRHGTGTSNELRLTVKYAPQCRSGLQEVYGGGKYESLNVTCSVEAHPQHVTFKWAFNSSSEVVDIPKSEYFQVSDLTSVARYTPRSHLDYGSLLCWADNGVAQQPQPCIFHIIHATTPEPVNNCTVENVSSTGASVRCSAGWDGGLEQTFTISVSEVHNQATVSGTTQSRVQPRVLAYTSTSPRPEFTLTDLHPGLEYVLTILSVNKKGASQPMRLAIFTFEDPDELHSSIGTDGVGVTPMLGIGLGILTGFVFCTFLICLTVRCRGAERNRKPDIKMVMDKPNSDGRVSKDADTEESNPDVIPVPDEADISKEVHHYSMEGFPISDVHQVPKNSHEDEHFQQNVQLSKQECLPEHELPDIQRVQNYPLPHESDLYTKPSTTLLAQGLPAGADSSSYNLTNRPRSMPSQRLLSQGQGGSSGYSVYPPEAGGTSPSGTVAPAYPTLVGQYALTLGKPPGYVRTADVRRSVSLGRNSQRPSSSGMLPYRSSSFNVRHSTIQDTEMSEETSLAALLEKSEPNRESSV